MVSDIGNTKSKQGCTLGMIAAYFGGRIDAFIMRVVDIQLSFPAILVALILLAVIKGGPNQPGYFAIVKITIALVEVQWAYYARTIRGSALVERRKEYVEAANCLALSNKRVLFRHLLPNCIAPIIVVGTMQTAHAISLEATLSFLGLGVQPPDTTLGTLIAEGKGSLDTRPSRVLIPGALVTTIILSVNFIGDGLRDALDPRLRSKG